MSAPGSFKQAREALHLARNKLTAIDDVLGLMDMLADSIRHRGFVPELVYCHEKGRVSLNVVVGQVPPRVSVTVGEAPVPVAAKPSLGDLSDAAQGLAPPAPRAVVTETIKLPPAFAPSVKRLATEVAEIGRVTPTYKTGEWTVEEEAKLLRLHHAGKLIPDMVAELGRKGPGIAAKLRYLLAKRIPSAAAAPAPAPVAPPPPRPAAPPPAAGPVLPPGPSLPRLQREAEARWIVSADVDWPARRDLDLIERMARGDGAGATAEAMGLEKPQVLARWRAIFPDPPTIEQQTAMLAVLRARVAA